MLDPLAASTLGEAGNASLHFGQGDRAKIKAIFVRLGEPGDNLGIGVLAGRLAKNVGVEEVIQRSRERGSSFGRWRSRSIPFIGESNKKSANDPRRFVFRSHSSAETTTTAGRPFRVIIWGAFTLANSTSSLNLAFASATVQFLSDGPNEVIIVMMVILGQRARFFRPIGRFFPSFGVSGHH